ncbi:MAG: TetR/AcrR family transcriptional regulator [candidate division Zixibacteria bacterium]|nr:TetR/AcrR family transcriptional regulator [candidate division Zixibacteria bacterium]
MRRIKQSPKMPAEKRRKQLLASARKLFVKKGYRGTTTEEIARKAGLTKGALYFHFKSKEDILLELVKSISESNRTALERELKQKVSPVEIFRLLLSLHCKCDVNEYGDLMDIWVQAWRVPRTRRYITRRLRNGLERFTGSIDASFVPSKTDPTDLGMLIIALVHGISSLRLLLPSAIDLDAQVSLFESFIDTSSGKNRKKGRV